MNLSEIDISPYYLNFITPFQTSQLTLTKRFGIIIKMISESGNIGLGDVCPPLSFNKNDNDELIDLIKNYILNLQQINNLELNSLINQSHLFLKKYPQSIFIFSGFEQAFISLLLKDNEISIYNLIDLIFNKTEVNKNKSSIKIRNKIPINAVIGMMDVNETISIIEKKLSEGYKSIKIKIGRENFEEDINIIKTVRNKFKDKINIRLDANGFYKLNDAIEVLQKLENYNIEYVEQPISDVFSFPKIREKTSVFIATDDSIKNINDATNIINNRLSDLIILKPLWIGGLINSLKIIKLANENNIDCIVSSVFESNIGKRVNVFVSSLLENNYACGLSTNEFFSNNIEEDFYPIKNGFIEFNNLIF
ncbi:MAG: hypothetical protein STSR0008_05060 [Ignavibacterium sp.]